MALSYGAAVLHLAAELLAVGAEEDSASEGLLIRCRSRTGSRYRNFMARAKTMIASRMRNRLRRIGPGIMASLRWAGGSIGGAGGEPHGRPSSCGLKRNMLFPKAANRSGSGLVD